MLVIPTKFPKQGLSERMKEDSIIQALSWLAVDTAMKVS